MNEKLEMLAQLVGRLLAERWHRERSDEGRTHPREQPKDRDEVRDVEAPANDR